MTEERKNACRLLGVSETASQAELQAACDDQLARFDEMKYLGSPLADMAAQKREQIRAAYRLLAAPEPAEPPVFEQPAPEYAADPHAGESVSVRVRRLLNAGKAEEADALLSAQTDAETNPEYVYLRGMTRWKQGWLDEACQYVDKATKMAPKNDAYKAASGQILTGLPPASKVKRSFAGKTGWAVCGCLSECLCEALCESICEGC